MEETKEVEERMRTATLSESLFSHRTFRAYKTNATSQTLVMNEL